MKLVKATLIKHSTTDGLFNIIEEQAPIGKEYIVDVDSLTTGTFYNTDRCAYHIKKIVDVYEDGLPAGYFVAELLLIEAEDVL